MDKKVFLLSGLCAISLCTLNVQASAPKQIHIKFANDMRLRGVRLYLQKVTSRASCFRCSIQKNYLYDLNHHTVIF